MDYETLIVEAHGAVRLIRLNRPEALNALNRTLVGELAGALEAFDADDAVRCVVVTGSAKAFAAGADIKEMSSKGYADMLTGNPYAVAQRRIQAIRKPVIAAVSGFCLGGGCELAMMCDFIIAADTARFGQPEINLGIIPGMGGTQRLARFVGKSKAMEMVLTGRMIDAAEAERSGLVSRVVPADKLEEEALAAAAKIASQSMPSTRMNKELVNAVYETSLSSGLALESRMFESIFAFDDQKEGMAAFVEKRKPKFTDR